MGDPAGIGREVTRAALNILGLEARWVAYAPAGFYGDLSAGVEVAYLPPDARCPALDAVERSAADLATGAIDAVVTSPVDKQVFGGVFPGHTELYAARCGVAYDDVAMWMAGPRLNVVPVTRHVALSAVASLVTTECLVKAGLLLVKALRASCGREPVIAVAGLNPHAGDGGLFGDEESRAIAPAVASLCAEGVLASGPHSPDTVFHHALAGRFDGVICCYHDQGLIPFKLVHFSDGVNVTLGLPRPRTSPDHGPAFDIAGRDLADPTSMIRAVELALSLSRPDPLGRAA